MSQPDNEPTETEADTGSTITIEREIDTKGREEVEKAIREEEREQQEELTEGEKRKRRIMQQRLNRTVSVADNLGDEDGVSETYEFTVLDGEELDWLEDEPMSLVGTDEEEMGSEETERYSRMKRRMTRMLVEHSSEDAFNYEFWKQAYGPEERAQLLGRIRREQNAVDDEGNR